MILNKVSIVAMVIKNHEKLLLVRKRNTLIFMLPGGKRNELEDDIDCLMREIKEELKSEIDKCSLRKLGVFTERAAIEPNTWVDAMVYVGKLFNKPEPAAEIEEIHWYDCLSPCTVTIAPLVKNSVIPELMKNL